MHGGGFISLSSRGMQIYTRKWANALGIPIFSIDYRMVPDFPFPTAPKDCYIVYQFIVNHIHKYFNIKPTKIYISGDSAGGNLSCVLTGMILK
jgi:hormone-sensitive lipase